MKLFYTDLNTVLYMTHCVDIFHARRELYHVQRELLRERTRCKALEEELENPMNIHRWRKLEVHVHVYRDCSTTYNVHVHPTGRCGVHIIHVPLIREVILVPMRWSRRSTHYRGN